MTAGATARGRSLDPGLLVAESLRYARAGRMILDGVGLTVQPGRSVAVVGPSGSGKSTLLALLAGLEAPDAGDVRRSSTARLGLVLQGYGLASVLTAAENVEVPLQARGAGGHRARRAAAAALESVGLAAVADHLVEELSGGQQQRVAIARALVVDPDILLADELSAELDAAWSGAVIELALEVPRRGGILVVATHDPQVANRCDEQVRL